MRVLVAANLTPFLQGGAQEHIRGLSFALREAGHAVETLLLPFGFGPESEVLRAMAVARGLDMTAPNGQQIDRVIGLQFPAYGIAHPHMVGWVMHQHRAVYELFVQAQAGPERQALRQEVLQFDAEVLGPLSEKRRLFANSARVAERLKQFNGLGARPLYHPPPQAEAFFCEPAEDYVFFPSRFESLKRQSLVIDAAAHLQTPVRLVLAGQGGQWQAAQSQCERLGLGDRVRLVGRVSAAEKVLWYAKSLGVVYPPFDEDYGYVTLEAMLSAKPVITCTDSGGPLEFVRHEETGLVVPPDPQSLAQAIDRLYQNKAWARQAGQQGRAQYAQAGIGWPQVVQALLQAA